MLCLKCDSNPEWINSAVNNIEKILIDHAHCEKKAAATGLSLLSTYPEKTELSFEMADLVEEEISHYRDVLSIIKAKGLEFTKDKGDPYVKKLLSHLNKNEPMRFLDRLLTAGIIEARSCERLKLLSENISDEKLKDFYKNLVASEAGHYMTFVKLAKLYFEENLVERRLDELTEIEKDIVQSLRNEPTMHG